MTREELIAALKGLAVETGSLACLGCDHEHDCTSKGCAVIREAIEVLKVERWIPTADRLPNEGEVVLTLDKWGHIHDRQLYTFRDGTQVFCPDGLSPKKDISHWKPVPAGPDEERKCSD